MDNPRSGPGCSIRRCSPCAGTGPRGCRWFRRRGGRPPPSLRRLRQRRPPRGGDRRTSRLTVRTMSTSDCGFVRDPAGDGPLNVSPRSGHALVPHHHQVEVAGMPRDLHRRVAFGHDPLGPVAFETGGSVSEHDVTDQLVADVDQGDLGAECLGECVPVACRLMGGQGAIRGEQGPAVGVLPMGIGGPHHQDVDW